MGDKKNLLPLVSGVQGEARNQDEFREAAAAGLEALQRPVLAEAVRAALDTPPVDAGAVIAATEKRLQAEALSASGVHMRRQTEQVRETQQFREDTHTLAEAQRDKTSRAKKPDTPRTEASSKASEWRDRTYPLERVLGGAEANTKDFADILIGKDGKVPFSIPMLLAAVEANKLQGYEMPVKDKETRAEWVRALYPTIKFNTTRVADQEAMQGLLNKAYLEGYGLQKDGELETDINEYILRAV